MKGKDLGWRAVGYGAERRLGVMEAEGFGRQPFNMGRLPIIGNRRRRTFDWQVSGKADGTYRLCVRVRWNGCNGHGENGG